MASKVSFSVIDIKLNYSIKLKSSIIRKRFKFYLVNSKNNQVECLRISILTFFSIFNSFLLSNEERHLHRSNVNFHVTISIDLFNMFFLLTSF